MRYKKILVPYDRSVSAQMALKEAIEIAHDCKDAKVTVFYVADVPDFNDATFEAAAKMSGVAAVGDVDSEKLRQNYLLAAGSEIESDTADLVGADHGIVEYAVGRGKPNRAIVKYASENGSDLIVMGSRGLNAVSGMLGSVSYAVLRSASCPVMVVK